ncbi:tetratricopeptide repeat protein [Fodinicola feengrottensis]|nr:tetratricopeptide repeat protein [Fodinicola feengrottensis]
MNRGIARHQAGQHAEAIEDFSFALLTVDEDDAGELLSHRDQCLRELVSKP